MPKRPNIDNGSGSPTTLLFQPAYCSLVIREPNQSQECKCWGFGIWGSISSTYPSTCRGSHLSAFFSSLPILCVPHHSHGRRQGKLFQRSWLDSKPGPLLWSVKRDSDALHSTNSKALYAHTSAFRIWSAINLKAAPHRAHRKAHAGDILCSTNRR